ncbi:MAG: hypothetical protein ACRDJ5_02610 [Actinomycetota bacterium]
MAMLAGAQLASNTLRLTEGSESLLPEMFPRVPHIRRINLKVAAAQELLDDAELHLGAMAVPYTLALHEDFMLSCLSLLKMGGLCTQPEIDNASSSSMHGLFEQKTRAPLPWVSLEQFHLLRLLRNHLIHSGGRPGNSLCTHVRGMSSQAKQQWKAITRRDASFYTQPVARVSMLHGELIIALAVTRRIAEAANEAIQPTLPRELWADIVFTDFEENHGLPSDRGIWLRKIRGWARVHYGPVSLTNSELEAAIARAGG